MRDSGNFRRNDIAGSRPSDQAIFVNMTISDRKRIKCELFTVDIDCYVTYRGRNRLGHSLIVTNERKHSVQPAARQALAGGSCLAAARLDLVFPLIRHS